MDQYALYLRKSRADLDAEARGEGETLAKHRAALTAMAKRRGLLIVREYAELVSGDTIAARPQMQALLADVKAGAYAGVIVNDIDRLGRGDGIDQEIIKYTFAASRTLIVTPTKDIDFSNETDEDLYDFKAFFARKEYKMISRRMQQGRTRTALSGAWAGGSAPYGYKRNRNGSRVTLEIDEQAAPIVRMIFDWYATGEAGYSGISSKLAAIGVVSNHGKVMGASTIRHILSNQVYIGKMAYGKTSTTSVIENSQRVKRRVKSSPAVVENVFPPIIDPETWDAVQARAKLARHRSPINTNAVMKCPLSSLIVCAKCGRTMVRANKRGGAMLVCPTPGCPTSGTYINIIESALLDTLRNWCATYAAPMTRPEPVETYAQREALQRQLDGISSQLTRAQELVETGVYTVQEYIQRKTALEGRRSALCDEIDKLTRKTPDEARAAVLPAVERVLDAYPLAQSAEQKNALLRSVIDHADYHKTQVGAGHNPAKLLSLDVFPISKY